MTKYKMIKKIRKWHRYLGLILGIQFLLWTLGGIYFSWTSIDEIRGDNLKKQKKPIALRTFVSPSQFLPQLLHSKDSLLSLRLSTVINTPFYELSYRKNGVSTSLLVNAINGKPRPLIQLDEAKQIAKNALTLEAPIISTDYFTQLGEHYEYRGRPLPAYAIEFGSPAHTTVYVSQDLAKVQTFRNTQWRIFDYLWMLHTMDYNGRDNFNNWLLRIFSVFGLLTILSGFVLYAITSKAFRVRK